MPTTFSISHDPFVGIAQRLRLVRDDGKLRAVWLVALAWIPLCLGALMRVAFGEPPAPILFDISVHTRLLLVIPLLAIADRVLDERCESAVAQLEEFCEAPALERILRRASRLRDSRVVELVLFVLAIAIGQAAFWGVIGSTGLVAGIDDVGGVSFARLWYASVALPIVQFLAARWLWHWLIWSYIVVRVSRLKLATIATHPDHTAGLGFLGDPIVGLSLFVLAVSAMMASAWGTQMLAAHVPLTSFIPSFIAFLLVAALLAVGPLLLYLGIMYRARYSATGAYNPLALEYVRAFHDRWIAKRSSAGEILGNPDIQSLSDLGGAMENLVRVRPVPFDLRALAGVWLAAILPMVPLMIAAMPVEELLRSIGEKMVGGLL